MILRNGKNTDLSSSVSTPSFWKPKKYRYREEEEEGIPFEHSSAIRQVNIEIKNRHSKVGN